MRAPTNENYDRKTPADPPAPLRRPAPDTPPGDSQDHSGNASRPIRPRHADASDVERHGPRDGRAW